MTYVFDIGHHHDADEEAVRRLLGGKGAGLALMARLGLSVPPGFTISTDACRAYLNGSWPDGLDDEIRREMSRLEAELGRYFGGPGEPLLVSVRSGSPISMPGMMDTILNVGLNSTTSHSLAVASGDRSFAESCHTRFIAMYRAIVGVEEVPDDPWSQLEEAVKAVFRSWNSDRCRAYREREGISDELGTAVTIQSMAFGNLGTDSATGVLFTRNPASGEHHLYGDVIFTAQGEDVVSGSHNTEPISVLDQRLPAAAAELRRQAESLERHFRDMCDIEFTIEKGKLWMLQVRIGKRSPQAALRIAFEMAEDPDFPLSREDAVRRVRDVLEDPPTITERSGTTARSLTRGLPASPGIASGVIATTPEQAVEMSEAGLSVILVRRETSPKDVHGMARSSGILTTTGGLASHAAVVARGWGIPAVVGAGEFKIAGDTVDIGGRRLTSGDVVTIDGKTGEVFDGEVDAETSVVPEAEKLLSWAEEIGLDIDVTTRKTAQSGDEGLDYSGTPGVDSLSRALLIKGYTDVDALAKMLLLREESVSGILEEMRSKGLVSSSGPMLKLTDEGNARAMGLIAEDRDRWGMNHAEQALNAFIPLDQRCKIIVTSWQMRDVDSEQVMNDHTDQDYDQKVLADFASIHREVETWLECLCESLPRLGSYLNRLRIAADRVLEGEHAFIASPRVDSYHNVWFDLHEDLILLANRTREDEVAAGRA